MENVELLNEWSKKIFEANREKGFWDKKRNVGELLMLVTSELGEAMEAHRKDRFTTMLDKAWFDTTWDDPHKYDEHFHENIKDTFEDEIADALIRILDMCGGLDIDISFHVKAKLEYNQRRERLHGKKY